MLGEAAVRVSGGNVGWGGANVRWGNEAGIRVSGGNVGRSSYKS